TAIACSAAMVASTFARRVDPMSTLNMFDATIALSVSRVFHTARAGRVALGDGLLAWFHVHRTMDVAAVGPMIQLALRSDGDHADRRRACALAVTGSQRM